MQGTLGRGSFPDRKIAVAVNSAVVYYIEADRLCAKSNEGLVVVFASGGILGDNFALSMDRESRMHT